MSTGSLPRLEDLPLQRGTRVLLRADFNVPLSDGGRIEDDLRIRAALPTIEWLLDREAAVICCSHLGRPKGAPDPKYSMARVAHRLADMMDALHEKRSTFMARFFLMQRSHLLNQRIA